MLGISFHPRPAPMPGPARTAVDLRVEQEDGEFYLQPGDPVDWRQHIGRSINVRLIDGSDGRVFYEIPQQVHAESALDPAAAEVAARLRARASADGPGLVEAAAWLVRTRDGIYVSPVSTGGYDSVRSDSMQLDATLLRAFRASGNFAQIRSVELLHTHPETGPLSIDDVRSLAVYEKHLAGHGILQPGARLSITALSQTPGAPIFVRERVVGHPRHRYAEFANPVLAAGRQQDLLDVPVEFMRSG